MTVVGGHRSHSPLPLRSVTGSYTSSLQSCRRGQGEGRGAVPRQNSQFSRNTTSAGAAVVPSVSWLTAFQHQASKAPHVLYAPTARIRVFFFFFTLYVSSLRHFNRTKKKTLTATTDSQTPTFLKAECFVLLNAARVEQHSSSSPNQSIRLATFVLLLLLLLSLPIIIESFFFFHCNAHLYFANVIFFFFFTLCLLQGFSLAHKNTSLCCC